MLLVDRQIYAVIFNTDKAEMNCSAGLALMKIKACDQPKISTMKIQKTEFNDEHETIKHLFQELFQTQIQLERYNDPRFYFYEVIKTMILILDDLMQFLMDEYED